MLGSSKASFSAASLQLSVQRLCLGCSITDVGTVSLIVASSFL